MEERAEYLVETYADTILRLCRSYLREPSDAQDVCQTVFLKLLTEPRSGRRAASGKRWAVCRPITGR